MNLSLLCELVTICDHNLIIAHQLCNCSKEERKRVMFEICDGKFLHKKKTKKIKYCHRDNVSVCFKSKNR